MKKVMLLIFLAFFGCSLPVVSYAQTTDGPKAASKFTKFVNNVKAKIVHAYKWVADSKFGKFIGKAVEATKDGIQFAQDAYKAGMKAYNNAMGYVEDVKNSKTYKAAMISKQIAEESMRLKEMQEQKLKIEEEYKQNIELEQETARAKLNALNQNISQLTAAGADSASMNAQIDQIQTNMMIKENQLEKGYKSDVSDINDKIFAQLKVIAELTKQLADVAEIKITKNNPMEALQETQEKFFAKLGEIPSERERYDLRMNLYKERREVVYRSYRTALESKHKIDGLKEEVQNIQDLASAMPGKSENSGVNAEVLIRQAEILRQYVEFVLADLELQTTVALAALNDPEPSDRLSKFKLCNYTDQKSGLAALKEKAASAKDKLGDAVAKGQELKQKAEEAKQKVEEAKEKVTDKINEGMEIYNQANELAENAGALTESLKGQVAVGDML